MTSASRQVRAEGVKAVHFLFPQTNLTDALTRAITQRQTQGRVVHKAGDRRSDARRVPFRGVRVDPDAGLIVHRCSGTADVADDHGQPIAHGLEDDISSRLPIAGEDEDVRGPVKLLDLLPLEPSVKTDPPGQTEVRGEILT